MKIRTVLLKSALSKIIKGVGNNASLPITSLISIEISDDLLELITTDGVNQFRAKFILSEHFDGDRDFYAAINADMFYKLVNKTTSEFIDLDICDSYLEFKGNGKYKLELAINEDGNIIRFYDIKKEKFNAGYEINLKDLQECLKTAKASTLKNYDDNFRCLSGYYFGDSILTTDRQLVCKIDKQIFKDSLLLSSEMADLILLLDLDDVYSCKFEKNDEGSLLFNADKYIIYGKQLEGKEIFENSITKAINNLTTLVYNQTVHIRKDALLNILDRMSLFVNSFDDGTLKLDFSSKDSAIHIKNVKSNACEYLYFEDGYDVTDFSCLVNLDMLKKQLKSLISNEVILQFDGQKSIQFKEGNTTLVLSLLTE